MSMYRLLFTLAITILCGNIAVGQEEGTLSQEEQYAYNIQQEYLNDVYIPKDVLDAMRQIDLLSEEAARAKMLEVDEQLAADRLVRGLGKWMIVKWNFYEGSRLSHHLKELGVSHPDDIAHFLIVSYHRYLSKKDLEIESRAQTYYDKRLQDQQERNEKKIKRTGGGH